MQRGGRCTLAILCVSRPVARIAELISTAQCYRTGSEGYYALPSSFRVFDLDDAYSARLMDPVS
jgi:hypothetical protein